MPVPETHEGDHPEPSKRNYLLHEDGSGPGTTDNPAQGAIGVVLRDPDGHPIAEISKRIGPAINTVSEYRALSRTGFHGHRVSWLALLIEREILVSFRGA